MSQDVLLVAVRDHLRAKLADAGVGPESVEVMFDGRPAPRAGTWFVAVHEGAWRADGSIGSPDLMLPEVLGCEVTVTLRCGVAPYDRIAVELVQKKARGLTALCRKVAVAVHMNYDLMARANAELGTQVNGFFHPLVFEDGGRSTPQGPAWWQAKGTKSNPPAGLSRTLSFGGCQRVQRLEDMA